ncbi:hypothetical protein C5167_038353 [Papaver somniferum]|uniref:Uncharacterized protein n=1 Tax=Papaver somniferum TaxID=3469 RepID=A0A4Y7I8Y4_PAPSO|nr:hypothetical protein C5167_038353 [Papaver somniferum]
MKYGSTKIVSDEEFVAKEVELEDPVENISAKLVRQADAKYTSLVDEKPKDSPSSMSTKSVHERLAEEDETRSLGWLPASG